VAVHGFSPFVPRSLSRSFSLFLLDIIANNHLPDAIEEYALMTNLVLINVSHSASLARAPLGWAYVPNKKLTIDLSGSKMFSELPFQLCSSSTNLTNLKLSGTKAASAMNWKGQLLAANRSGFKFDALNAACLNALKGLTTLSLAANNLTSK
jgi:hypothetical protein